MQVQSLPAWFERVQLHPDVETGKFTRATFAIDFGGLLAGDPNVPLVYQDSRAFWTATHLTASLRRLLEEVLGLLSGGDGDRVLQLRSPFGGGKSHVLVALYHAVRDRKALLAAVPEASSLPDPGTVRVAGLDGEKFDPVKGMEIGGRTVRTLWGALGIQLDCFELVADHERSLTAPGGDVVKRMLGSEPTLVLLDEVLRYVERALTIPVGESNLGRQALEFLQTLTTEVAGSSRAVLVYSLQASAREAFENVGLLAMLDHLASRVDAKREAVTGDEVLLVVKKRLLAGSPPEDAAEQAAQALAKAVTRWRISEAPDEAARRHAQDDEVRLRRRLHDAYPFHVGLIDLMKERWASLPDFQRTRGALRFLATVLHRAKTLGRRSVVLGPGDVPMDDAEVRNAFFTEVGQREPFQAVLEHDLIGPNARAKRIDRQMEQQNPALSQVRPATRLATAILLYSFGGAPRSNGEEPMPPGATERELLEVCLGPDLDPITAQTALKRLREECLYLHFDGVRYCFKTTPNINLLLEQEAENVRAEEVDTFVKQELEQQLPSRQAVVWPKKSSEIPDKPRLLVAYLPLEFAGKPTSQQDSWALEVLSYYGEDLRNFRRALALAVPDMRQVEGVRRAAKYLVAAERVKTRRAAYRLTKEQIDQLQERKDTELAAFKSGLRSLYTAIWVLGHREGQPVVEKLALGGRPLRAQGLHERLMEYLKEVEGRTTETLKPHKLLEFFGEKPDGSRRAAIETKTLRDYYFGSPAAPVVPVDEEVLQRAVADGVRQGMFAYTWKDRVRQESGLPRVRAADAALGREVSPDEIDLERGCLLLPECVETPAPGVPPVSGPPDKGPNGVPPQPGPGTPPAPGGPRPQKVARVCITMRVGKTSLYKTFHPLANLAERADTIRVTVEAEHPEGFDATWLRNAVREPLEEAGVDLEECPGPS